MKRKTIPAFFLALALVFSLSTGALAAGTTTATVPVTLTVSNEYRAVNVTVRAALPARANAAACFAVRAIGFSKRTCLPASNAAMA